VRGVPSHARRLLERLRGGVQPLRGCYGTAARGIWNRWRVKRNTRAG
jgi:hypothetical protein